MKKRIEQLDTIRTIAIISVLVCHSLESIYNLSPSFFITYPFLNQIILLLLRLFSRIGVPLFLFLTGFLLLPKEHDKESIKKFNIKKLLPLLVCWEIWIVIHNLLSPLLLNVDFNFMSMIRQMFFIDYLPYTHSWYMPMIIGIYLFIPLVSLVLNSINGKTIIFIMSIIYIYCFIVPTINIYLPRIESDIFISNYLDLSFSGCVYGFYLVIGYLTKKYIKIINNILTPLFKIALFILSLLSILVTILFQYFCYHAQNPYGNLWYDTFTLPVISIILFIFLINMKPFWVKLFAKISRASFGIYLVHRIIQMIIVGYFIKYLNINNGIKFILLSLLSFIASYLLIAIVNKISLKISKILFLYK